MSTIHLKGPGLNDYFAERTVIEFGPEAARKKSSGPMLEAVERAIVRLAAEAQVKKDQA